MSDDMAPWTLVIGAAERFEAEVLLQDEPEAGPSPSIVTERRPEAAGLGSNVIRLRRDEDMTASQSVPSSPKTRVQIDFTPRDMERINFMTQLCDFDTRKELFNTAFSVLEWVIAETRAGRVVGSFDEGRRERRVLSIPVLETVRRDALRSGTDFIAARPLDEATGMVDTAAAAE